jgi:hypothetical protein
MTKNELKLIKKTTLVAAIELVCLHFHGQGATEAEQADYWIRKAIIGKKGIEINAEETQPVSE